MTLQLYGIVGDNVGMRLVWFGESWVIGCGEIDAAAEMEELLQIAVAHLGVLMERKWLLLGLY